MKKMSTTFGGDPLGGAQVVVELNDRVVCPTCSAPCPKCVDFKEDVIVSQILVDVDDDDDQEFGGVEDQLVQRPPQLPTFSSCLCGCLSCVGGCFCFLVCLFLLSAPEIVLFVYFLKTR
jgi:hypothetical protein